jgi:23S rRNA pseudouridine2605 synthase
LILQGRVHVDGQLVRELGTRVDPRGARIEVDGQRIHLERFVYFAVNKPKGYVSTNNDPSGRPRVIDLLPEIPQRVYSVGRLDEMSVGLMILTNDGELANKLAHPKFGVEKLYRAVVAGSPTREILDKLTEGVWLAEGKVRAKRVRVVGHRGESTILEMVLAEGKNREVRRMLAKFGHKVMSLTRSAVGPITLRGLKPGEFRPLSNFEVDQLRKVAAGIPLATGSSPADRRPSRPPRRGPGRPGRAPAHVNRPAGGAAPPPPPRPHHRRVEEPPPEGVPPRIRRVEGGPAPRRTSRPPDRARRAGGGAGGQPPRPPQAAPPPPSVRRPPREAPPTRKIIGLNEVPPELGPAGIRPRRLGAKKRTEHGDRPAPRPPRLKRLRRPRPTDEL